MKWLDRLTMTSNPTKNKDSPVGTSPPQKAGRPKKAEMSQKDSTKEERLASLTPREREVFALLMEGLTMRESAEELGVKFTTVNSHCSHIYRKLGVNSRAEFILRYAIHRDRDR